MVIPVCTYMSHFVNVINNNRDSNSNRVIKIGQGKSNRSKNKIYGNMII